MKERSPTIPPCTWASATPKAPLMAHIPMKVPSPPFPEVAKSNYSRIIINKQKGLKTLSKD